MLILSNYNKFKYKKARFNSLSLKAMFDNDQ